MSKILIALFIAAAAVFANFSFFVNRVPIPRHMMGHTLVDKADFLSNEIVEALLENTRQSSPIFSTVKEPAVFINQDTEDNIGEAVDAVVDPKTGAKSCPQHGLLALDNSGTRCVFPGRVDVGRHYIMSGGPEAKKEKRETLISRVQPFLHYITDYKKDPVTKKLLEAPEMQKFSLNICPASKKHIVPFQFNYVVQLPGQTVASHIDAVYFRHASRLHIPQWLLSAMAFSNIPEFQSDFVDQVQVVAYYHKWSDDREGQFLFWNDPVSHVPQLSKPLSRSANSVDGSKVVHAAGVYMPWRTPPQLPRVARNTLEYRVGSLQSEGKHTWDVKSDGKVIATYDENELRFSAVYRCKCFKNEADEKEYDELQSDKSRRWNTTYVLDLFRRDMDKKGVLAAGASIAPVDLGELILKTYIKYPLSPTALIPFNVCAASEIPALKFLKPLLDLFC